MPALGREGIGADHETIRKLHERGAPGRVDLAAAGMVAAKRQVAPQVLVLAQHGTHLVRRVEAGMRPQDPGLRVLLELALDGVGIRMRVQEQLVFARQLDDTAHHRQVGVGAIDMVFADGDIPVRPEPRLQVRHDAGVPHPGADLAALAVRPQHRDHQIGRLGEQFLRAVVAAARHHRAAQARLAQDVDGRLGWQLLPGIMAVMQVRIEDRHGRRGTAGNQTQGPGTQPAQMDFHQVFLWTACVAATAATADDACSTRIGAAAQAASIVRKQYATQVMRASRADRIGAPDARRAARAPPCAAPCARHARVSYTPSF